MPDKNRFQAVLQPIAFDAYNSSVTGNVTASGNLVLGAGSRIVCGTGYVENPIFKQVIKFTWLRAVYDYYLFHCSFSE